MTGPRTDINEIIAAGDVFVNVSRSALEAMASEKPVILAGNEGYIGLLSSENMEAARESNFCCRGFSLSTEGAFWRISCNASGCPGGTGVPGRGRTGLYPGRVFRQPDDGRLPEGLRGCPPPAVQRRHERLLRLRQCRDEAILQSIHQNIESLGSDIAITVLSSDRRTQKSGTAMTASTVSRSSRCCGRSVGATRSSPRRQPPAGSHLDTVADVLPDDHLSGRDVPEKGHDLRQRYRTGSEKS